MRKTLIAIAALIIATSAHAQTATKVTASKANEYGLIYSLPNTVFDVTIETEYTKKEPGEFYNYANRTLNATNAITKPSATAKVKSVTIVPRGVADKENEWLMQFKAGQAVFVMLDDANMPIAINTEDAPTPAQPNLPTAQAAQPTPLESPAAQQAVTQEMTMSSSLTKRAQLAGERIFELRSQRNDLISGQADNTPPDGKSMQLALDNLSAQEAALTAMFVGTTKTWTEVNTVTYMPDTADVADIVLCRLSPTDGIVDASDLSGEPIYISMKVMSQGEMPTDEKGRELAFPKNGVAYCIPGSAKVTVSYQGKNIASKTADVAQLGVTYGLDPKFFADKKAPAYAIFNPTTGALVKIGTLDE